MKPETITASDGHIIQAYVWSHPTPIAWVHICHGMAEHALRYDHLAQSLVAQGYAVVAHNHRGHGPSQADTLGHFSDSDGWAKVLSDIETVRTSCTEKHVPYYMLAHSMGSFIVQSYLTTQPKDIDGLILSGSNYQNPWVALAGSYVANMEKWCLGSRRASKFMDTLSFGSFNKAFKPNRTDFDWLSQDENQVDLYINDPYCGFKCTPQLWSDLLSALSRLYRASSFKKIQNKLPILIISGDKDPVGGYGQGLEKLKRAYLAAGQQDVTLKLYSNGRHEILNETDREQVVNDVVQWLEHHIADAVHEEVTQQQI